MAKNESKLCQYIIENLKNLGVHITQHEDERTSGILDLSYGYSGTNGWIELKYIQSFPAHSGKVKIDISNDQIDFLIERNLTGGNCYLLVQVNESYFLFIGPDAFGIRQYTMADYYEQSIYYAVNKINFPKLLNHLT